MAVGLHPVDQVGMPALLGHPAVTQHQDLVGVSHRGQPVADDDHAAALSVLLQVGQDARCGASVHGGEGVVQQQQRRIDQQGAGNRQPLALAAGQRDATLAHRRVVALRQPADVLVHRCGFCRSPDLRAAGVGPGQCNVLGHAGGEQERLLRYPGYCRAQRAQAVVVQRNAAPADLALVGRPLALQQLEQAALAGAGRPDQAQGLAGRQLEAQARQRWPVLAGVGKVKVGGLQQAGRQAGLGAVVVHRQRRLQHGRQPGPGGAAPLDQGQHPAGGKHRPDQLAQVEAKAGELTQAHLVAPDQPAAKAQ